MTKQEQAQKLRANEKELFILRQAVIARKCRLQLECGVNRREYQLLHERWQYVEILREKSGETKAGVKV